MESKVEQVTVNRLSVTMTEEEWRAALGDPAPLMAAVRRELGALHRDNGKARMPAKKAGKPAGKGAGAGADRVECDVCHEEFSRRGLGIHKSLAHGIPGGQASAVPDVESPTSSSIPESESTVPGASWTS